MSEAEIHTKIPPEIRKWLEKSTLDTLLAKRIATARELTPVWKILNATKLNAKQASLFCNILVNKNWLEMHTSIKRDTHLKPLLQLNKLSRELYELLKPGSKISIPKNIFELLLQFPAARKQINKEKDGFSQKIRDFLKDDGLNRYAPSVHEFFWQFSSWAVSQSAAISSLIDDKVTIDIIYLAGCKRLNRKHLERDFRMRLLSAFFRIHLGQPHHKKVELIINTLFELNNDDMLSEDLVRKKTEYMAKIKFDYGGAASERSVEANSPNNSRKHKNQKST